MMLVYWFFVQPAAVVTQVGAANGVAFWAHVGGF
jgi:hypothetical protein